MRADEAEQRGEQGRGGDLNGQLVKKVVWGQLEARPELRARLETELKLSVQLYARGGSSHVFWTE